MFDPKKYIGRHIDGAKRLADSAGVPLRVIKRDGSDIMGTMDFVPGRLNVEVEKGTVVSCIVEGQE